MTAVLQPTLATGWTAVLCGSCAVPSVEYAAYLDDDGTVSTWATSGVCSACAEDEDRVAAGGAGKPTAGHAGKDEGMTENP